MLVTSTGGAESNSYISVEEADSILATYLGDSVSEAWTNSTEAQKELRLIMAAAAIEWLPLTGRRAYRNQAMAFPRTSQSDPYVVPLAIRECQAFMAHDGIGTAAVSALEQTMPVLDQSPVRSLSIGALSFSLSDTYANQDRLSRMIRSSQFPIYLKLQPYVSIIRGGSIPTTAELTAAEEELLTTTTD